jgi:hypothetical protein
MRARIAACLCLAGVALLGRARAEDGDVQMKPLHFGGVQEFGMIRKGLLVSDPVTEFTDEWVDHFGTFFTQEAMIKERLELKLGLGGIFEWPKPEKASEEFGGSQYKLFYVGPSIAEATYHFGGADGMFTFGGGMFPYQYNRDAYNLGEYLFRSGPYPTFLMTGGLGGLTVIGDQFTVLEGFKASAHIGNLKLDLLLSTETGMPPLYDWSLAAVADYSIADGLVDFGAGVNFKRIIPVDAKKTRVKVVENSYFKHTDGRYYVGAANYYSEPAAIWGGKGDAAQALRDTALAHGDLAGFKLDSANEVYFHGKRDSLNFIADSVSKKTDAGGWQDSNTGLLPGAGYYTPAGVIVMGRVSVDLKKIFASDLFAKDDLRLYAEAAVIGMKNYPIYYEKMTDRMPIMAGINLPTFHLLDLFAVQFEYFNSPNLNNHQPIGDKNLAIPYIPRNTDTVFSQHSYNDLTKKDNYAWSILLRKQVFSVLTLNAQVARDHLRTVGTDWFYGSRFEPTEVLHKSSSSWYWMFQLGWSL